MKDIKFSFATAKDRESVEALLSDCGLPHQDVVAHLPHFILAQKDAQLIGVIGLELLGTVGLLRSLAVSEAYRGQGLAKALYARLSAYANQKQIKTLYLLTLTAEGFFAKLGFKRIDRKNVPEALQETEEFRHLCPDTAVCMAKYLEAEEMKAYLITAGFQIEAVIERPPYPEVEYQSRWAYILAQKPS